MKVFDRISFIERVEKACEESLVAQALPHYLPQHFRDLLCGFIGELPAGWETHLQKYCDGVAEIDSKKASESLRLDLTENAMDLIKLSVLHPLTRLVYTMRTGEIQIQQSEFGQSLE